MRETWKVRHFLLCGAVLAGSVGVVAACGDGDSVRPVLGVPTPTDAGAKEAAPPAPADGSPGLTPDSAAPTDEHTVDIGTSYATACALSNKGRLKCWGDASDGLFLTALTPKKCFDPASTEVVDCDHRAPTDVPLPFPVEKLFVGYLSTCIVATEGGTKKLGCWGRNDNGRLTSAAGESSLVTSIVWPPLPAPPKRVVDGRSFKLVELEDGTLWGWGANNWGQFAGPTLDVIGTPTKVWPFSRDGGVVDAGAIVDIAASRINSFVFTTSGLWMTGDNSYGLGMNVSPPPELFEINEFHEWTPLPTDLRSHGEAAPPELPDPPVKLFRGLRAEGACYLTASGKAFCWGPNTYGQAGSPRTEVLDPVYIPELVEMPAGRKLVDISIGSGNICGLTEDKSVFCWGYNDRGTAAQSPPGGNLYTPALVSGLSDVKKVSVGTMYFGCALTDATHKTYCWGDNGYGQLGTEPDGGAESYSVTPREVPIVW